MFSDDLFRELFVLFVPLTDGCGGVGSCDKIAIIMDELGLYIDRSSSRSLTDQLTDALRAAIVSGRLKDGDKLPTRQKLMERTGVGKNVAHAAVARLVTEGLVCSRPRIGCLVMRPNMRPMRGHVLEVSLGRENSFWHSNFVHALGEGLLRHGFCCDSVGLPLNGGRSPDFRLFDYKVSFCPDLIVASCGKINLGPVVRHLDRTGIPYVMTDSAPKGRHANLLPCADTSKTTDAMVEFVDDCRRAGIKSVLWFAWSDEAGIDPRKLLEAAGIYVETLTFPPQTYSSGLDETFEKSQELMQTRLRKGPICDLIVSTDDYMTMVMLPVLLENGLRIPEDVRLVTLRNKGFGPAFTKSLSCFEYDSYQHGEKMAQAIVKWFKCGKFEMERGGFANVRGDTFPVSKIKRKENMR